MTDGLGARLAATREAAPLNKDLVGRVRRRLTDRAVAASPVAVLDAVRAEPAQAPLGGTTLLRLSNRLYDELAGAGPLGVLLADPAVTDIVVNGPTEVWIDRGAGMVRAPSPSPTRIHYAALLSGSRRLASDAWTMLALTWTLTFRTAPGCTPCCPPSRYVAPTCACGPFAIGPSASPS